MTMIARATVTRPMIFFPIESRLISFPIEPPRTIVETLRELYLDGIDTFVHCLRSAAAIPFSCPDSGDLYERRSFCVSQALRAEETSSWAESSCGRCIE